jgi:uncharacterized protein (DUF2267 family)
VNADSYFFPLLRTNGSDFSIIENFLSKPNGSEAGLCRLRSGTLAALELLKFHYGKASFSIQRDFQGGIAMRTGPIHRYPSARSAPRRKSNSDVFDGTLQKTHVWLNDVMKELNWQEHPNKAYLALRTVLHTLRDRLTIEEAVQLGAQLPMLVRGFYYEGWTLKGKPGKERHKEDFLAPIKEAFKEDFTSRPESIARAVFKTLARHTSDGEIDDVKHSLPKALRELWPSKRVASSSGAQTR